MTPRPEDVPRIAQEAELRIVPVAAAGGFQYRVERVYRLGSKVVSKKVMPGGLYKTKAEAQATIDKVNEHLAQMVADGKVRR